MVTESPSRRGMLGPHHKFKKDHSSSPGSPLKALKSSGVDKPAVKTVNEKTISGWTTVDKYVSTNKDTSQAGSGAVAASQAHVPSSSFTARVATPVNDATTDLASGRMSAMDMGKAIQQAWDLER